MIYTVTVNPALDYMLQVPDFREGIVNRAEGSDMRAGGKGLNVSWVLRELGQSSVCLGFAGGWTGEKLEKSLRDQGFETDFVHLAEGDTRINIKIQGEKETAVNMPGPVITAEEQERLLEKMEQLKEGDWLVMSGSLSAGMKKDFYCSVAKRVPKGVKLVLDCDGQILKESLKMKPFLVKPNIEELRALVGPDVTIGEGAAKLQKMGAENVLVSKGEDGAELFLADGSVMKCGALSLERKNTVGAGDSMVAGFLAGYIEKGDFWYALMLGSAAGVGTSGMTGLADRKSILDSLDLLEGELNI